MDKIVKTPYRNVLVPYAQYYISILASHDVPQAQLVVTYRKGTKGNTIEVEEVDSRLKDPTQFVVIGICAGLGVALTVLVAVGVHRYRKQRQETAAEGQRHEFVAVALNNLSGRHVLRSGGKSKWQSTVDPESGSIYYYNPQTRETRWDPPELIDERRTSIA